MGNRPSESSGNGHQKEETPIEISGRDDISSVAFLTDGRHIVGGGSEHMIRRWQVEDGKEVGTPMDAGSPICNIAVSRSGRWVVSGTRSGLVTVWNVKSDEKVSEFRGHSDWVRVLDVTSDGTRIATGSYDETVCVWSISTGQRLLGPLKHDSMVAAVKFSPDRRFIATATCWRDSLRIYDSQNGHLSVEFPIRVNSPFNQSLAWASDSKQLFALSLHGNIHCLDVSTGATRSQWLIHSSNEPRCIALAGNGTIIAASANSSVSFWDTTTHKQVGSVIEHTADVVSMAISENYEIVIAASKKITLRNIYDVLPSSYHEIVSVLVSEINRVRRSLNYKLFC